MKKISLDSFSSFNNDNEGGFVLENKDNRLIFKDTTNHDGRTLIIETTGENGELINIAIYIPQQICAHVLYSFFSEGYNFYLDELAGI